MSIYRSSLRDLDVPVENLFFLDRLLASEHALHLLNCRMRGRWPIAQLTAAVRCPTRAGSWAGALGYDDEEILSFHSLKLVESRGQFRARLRACQESGHLDEWQAVFSQDFLGALYPGQAGLLLGTDPADPSADPRELTVYGYLLAVRLHPHPGNAELEMLETEHLAVCGPYALCGGWLSVDDLPST